MTAYPVWFDGYPRFFFEKHLGPLAGEPDLLFLQLGVFTGDASVWLCEKILTHRTSQLVDVDTWAGSDEPEHAAFDWSDVEKVYDTRKPHNANKVRRPTAEYLRTAALEGDRFDFIYVDACHMPGAVLTDADLSWRVLKPGGLLAFDDYKWKHPDGEHKSPGQAIDRFLDEHTDLDLLDQGLQVWVRRK